MEIKGRIIAALPPRGGVSQKGTQWQVQEYVIEETDARYPKKIAFEVFGENIQKFNIQNGQEYTISFDIDARQWQDRWFNSIRAWKAEPVQTSQSSSPAPQQEVFKDPFAMAASQPSAPSSPAQSSCGPVSTGADTTASQPEENDLPF